MPKNSKVKAITIEKLLNQSDKKPLVEIRDLDVTFGYGQSGFKAIKNMNLNIYRGEVLGLVGESGSGKSTTGNAIAGIVSHSNGSIKVDDFVVPQNVREITRKIRKEMVSRVQMIFQDPAESLNPYKNIEGVVGEGLKNVDAKSIFMKSFDGKTINEVLRIIDEHEVKGFLDHLSHEKLHQYVEQNKHSLIERDIFQKAASELAKIDKPWAVEAHTYLMARSFERKTYFNGKSSNRKIIKKMVIETLKSVGLSERVLNRFPLEFSGGQQQRIGISRAILMNPKLLIADEPISALDVSIQAQVINILNNLKESMDLTILFIAHDLRMVEYISDRIAIMYKGTIVEMGDAHEVTANPIHPYSKMLLDAVPSIDGDKKSLIGYMYDSRIHEYSAEVQPSWFQIDDANHFVMGTEQEVKDWTQGKWKVYVENQTPAEVKNEL